MFQEMPAPGVRGGVQRWKELFSVNKVRVGRENFKIEKYTHSRPWSDRGSLVFNTMANLAEGATASCPLEIV